MIVSLLTALAPANPLRLVTPQESAGARDRWLLAVLLAGTVALARTEPWLACMAAYFFLHWHSPKIHPSLITWAGIGATWFLLRSIPAPAWDWIASGWVLIAVYQVARMVTDAWRGHHPALVTGWRGLGYRQKGSFGSPVLTALFLALVTPFVPWWLWPVHALGLWLTCSWHAFLAVGIGLAWLFPEWTPLGGVAALGAALLWCVRPLREQVLERTPRGNNFDAVVSRGLVWRLIWRHSLLEGTWLLGCGPYSLEPDMRRWAAMYRRDLPRGDAHFEFGQMWYEYGLLGAAAIVAFVLQIGSRLTMGDPWSAAWIIGCVLSLAHWPFRNPSTGIVWLAVGATLMG